MKIVSLQVENVQRVSCAEIKPDGSLVVIGGKNANGKTSILDSIMYAVGGKRSLSQQPVRVGAKYSEITLEFDEDYVVKQRIYPDKRVELHVFSKQGHKYSSPQKLLDSFLSKLSLDPLAFSRMKPEEQARILRDVVGLDFSAIDAEKKACYEQRRDLNRDVKNLEGELNNLQVWPDVPEEELSTEEISREAQEINERILTIKSWEANKLSYIEKGKQLSSEIKELEQIIVQKKAVIDTLVKSLREVDAMLASAVMPNQEGIQTKLAEINAVNQKVRDNQRYAAAQAKRQTLLGQTTQLTHRISDLEESKAKQIKEAKMPIPELSLSEDGVTYQGIPFAQISGAEKLRVSTCMVIAMNPRMGVFLIRDGSLLDEDNLTMMANIAEEHDAQVWIERVGEGKECSVIMEDGMVKNG